MISLILEPLRHLAREACCSKAFPWGLKREFLKIFPITLLYNVRRLLVQKGHTRDFLSFTETFIEVNRVQQNKLTCVKPLSLWKPSWQQGAHFTKCIRFWAFRIPHCLDPRCYTCGEPVETENVKLCKVFLPSIEASSSEGTRCWIITFLHVWLFHWTALVQ